MSEEQKKQLFIQHCLTKKDKIFLSEPMNTKHEAMYAAFKHGMFVSIDQFVDKVGYAVSDKWEPTDLTSAEEFFDAVLDCRGSENEM